MKSSLEVQDLSIDERK